MTSELQFCLRKTSEQKSSEKKSDEDGKKKWKIWPPYANALSPAQMTLNTILRPANVYTDSILTLPYLLQVNYDLMGFILLLFDFFQVKNSQFLHNLSCVSSDNGPLISKPFKLAEI